MRFVADESVDGHVVRALRAAGHHVLYIADEMASKKDADVLAFAVSRDEVLITEDKDFGDIVHVKRHRHAGVVLLRMNAMAPADRVSRALMVISVHGARLKDAFTVIDEKRVRIRQADPS